MSDGTRPGGLTALAILNFVWGGMESIFVMLVLIGMSAGRGTGLDWLVLLMLVATASLLIVSGIGYLNCKRVLGRSAGNGYAICSLAQSGLTIVSTGITIWTMVFFVYPLVTLTFINTTFKDDLVN